MRSLRNDICLILFLSRATPLAKWDKMGIFAREVAIYNKLRSRLGQLSIITSGGQEELVYQSKLPGINILYNRWKLSPNLYSILAPFLHYSALQKGTVYKTNQLDGSWTTINAGRLYCKPVIVRAGYLWAEHFESQISQGVKSKLINQLQAYAFKNASTINLTTATMKQHVSAKYDISSEKINVVPNYVDTDLFRPRRDIQPISGRICYIGRLHPRKNLHLLIKAMAGLPNCSLYLIGAGPQQAELANLATQYQVKVHFAGVLSNSQIPPEINRSEVFVLPSQFEGHPKALIEAMACGIPVIGTDVKGIRQVIRHEETGVLCSPTVDGIKEAIQQLLTDSSLRQRLGNAAHDFATREYSLDRIVQMELSVLQAVSDAQ